MLGGRSSVLSCWMGSRIRKRCCGGAIWRLLRGRRLLTGRLRRYWKSRGRRRSFMGSASQGLRRCLGSSGSVRDRREGVFLWGPVFYKICTMITHKLYVELRFRLVCMECREPRQNRHTVSLLTDRMVISPKVSRTRKRYVQAPYLSPGFGDFQR